MGYGIKRKLCKHEGCGKMPQIGLNGYCYTHAPEDIKSRYKSKKDLQVKNRNAAKYTATKLRMDNYKEDKELELWFKIIRNKLTGKCECGCGKPSSKFNDKFFKYSCAHLLPKKTFKSIATHPMNYLELNAFGDSCHATFDNMGYEHCKMTKPALWKIVVERFNIIYPSIAEAERKYIPEVLLETLRCTGRKEI